MTVNRDDAKVENFVECMDPAGDLNAGVNAGGQPEAFNAGTNYSRGRGQLAVDGSLLFTAPHTGTFWCQIRAHTDAGHDFKYRLTAVAAPRPGGTWLAVDNFTGDAPLWWQINTCSAERQDRQGRYRPQLRVPGQAPGLAHGPSGQRDLARLAALYPGHPGGAPERPVGRPPDATTASIAGHLGITSCVSRNGILPGAASQARRISGPGAW